jgi:hypothetical protein
MVDEFFQGNHQTLLLRTAQSRLIRVGLIEAVIFDDAKRLALFLA